VSRWTEYMKANALSINDFYATLDAQIDQKEKEEPEYWSEIERQRWEPIDNDLEYIEECCDE